MNDAFTRRDFLAGAAAVALAVGERASALSAAPDPFAEFDYDAVELTGGPLKQQYDRIHAAYLALDNDRLLQVYRERAGLPAPGEPMGGWYGRDGFVPGHSLGQYISGLARIGRTTGDAACAAKVAALVEGFAATLGPKDRCFAAPNAENLWPCYILDKHLAGLMDAYRLSGVVQARDHLLEFGKHEGRDGGITWVGSKESDRVIAPVVGKPLVQQIAVVDEGMNWQQFNRRNTSAAEVIEHVRLGQTTICPA